MIKRRDFLRIFLASGIVLGGTANPGLLFGASRKRKTIEVEMIYDFLEHLNEAQIVAGKDGAVVTRPLTISAEQRDVLFEHPDAEATFQDVPIYRDAHLSFGVGINERAWEKSGDGVLFEIILTDEQSKEHTVFSRYIDPKSNPAHRKWFDERIDLKAFEGKKVAFTFKASSGPQSNREYDWSGWSEPQINYIKETRVRTKNPKHLNVILIVIDTLR